MLIHVFRVYCNLYRRENIPGIEGYILQHILYDSMQSARSYVFQSVVCYLSIFGYGLQSVFREVQLYAVRAEQSGILLCNCIFRLRKNLYKILLVRLFSSTLIGNLP